MPPCLALRVDFGRHFRTSVVLDFYLLFMSNMKKLALIFGMTAALAGGHEPMRFAPRMRRKPSPKSPPKGAREFYFSQIGEVFTEKNEHTIFSCIARNEENARRKFNNHRFR